MALELETSIMRQIGLGQHYNWYNGSGSCQYIRKEAARKLPDAIQKTHDEGKEIAAPDSSLCNLVWKVASTDGIEVDLFGEQSNAVLTKTWEVASYVIQAHMRLHYATTPKQIDEIIRNTRKFITDRYLPAQQKRKYAYRRYGWYANNSWEEDDIFID